MQYWLSIAKVNLDRWMVVSLVSVKLTYKQELSFKRENEQVVKTFEWAVKWYISS